jgi:hypothetical protein
MTHAGRVRVFSIRRMALLVAPLAAAAACSGPNPAYSPRVGGDASTDRSPATDQAIPPRSDTSGPSPDGGPLADTLNGDVDSGTSAADTSADTPSPSTDVSPPPDAPDASIGPPADLRPDLAPDMPVALATGLVAHWDFEEGSGTRANDRTGRGNNATLAGSPQWVASTVPGAPGTARALRFDGSNDIATVAATSGLPAVQARKTVAFWMFADDPNASDQRSIVNLFNNTADAGIQVGTFNGRPAIWEWGAEAVITQIPDVPPRGWHHIVYTYDGNSGHGLYLDGSTSILSNSTRLRSGTTATVTLGTFEVGWEMYAGVLDEVRVYDRVLNLDEIRTLARGY